MLHVESFKRIKFNNKKTKYFISNLGEIKDNEGNIIKQYDGNRGYKFSILIIDGERHIFPIHRLVAQYFCKKGKNKNHIDHKDCNKHNNFCDNLEYVTSKENHRRAAMNGLYLSGDKHPMNKYSKKQIIKVCEMLENEENTYTDIEKSTGVHRDTVYRIRYGEKWKSISKNYDFSKRFIGNFKTPEKDIKKICLLLNQKIKVPKISKLTGISVHTIYGIKQKRSYTELSKKYLID